MVLLKNSMQVHVSVCVCVCVCDTGKFIHKSGASLYAIIIILH